MTTNQNDSKHKLREVAYVSMIVVTVMMSVAIIPLIWAIPMTLACRRQMNDLEEDTTVVGILSLFLMLLIPGILLLVANKWDKLSTYYKITN